MVTSLATVADLGIRVAETLTGNTQAQWFLDTASAIVRNYTGETWLNDEETAVEDVPEDVRRITVEIAARVWLNPDGNTQETVGPFTERRPDLFADGFFLTGTEKTLLVRYRTSSVGGLWTIQQTKGDYYDPNIYVPVAPQPGEDVPYFVPGTPGAQGL